MQARRRRQQAAAAGEFAAVKLRSLRNQQTLREIEALREADRDACAGVAADVRGWARAMATARADLLHRGILMPAATVSGLAIVAGSTQLPMVVPSAGVVGSVGGVGATAAGGDGPAAAAAAATMAMGVTSELELEEQRPGGIRPGVGSDRPGSKTSLGPPPGQPAPVRTGTLERLVTGLQLLRAAPVLAPLALAAAAGPGIAG